MNRPPPQSKEPAPALPFDVPSTGAPEVFAAAVVPTSTPATTGAAVFSEYRETTITRLCSDLARAFTAIGNIMVTGEVANAKSYPGGMGFLTLRDRGFELSVFVPASRARFCRYRNGDLVSVAGKLDLSPKKAQLQMLAREITPVGAGAIAAKLEQTRLRLAESGLLTRPRRRLPLLPQLVGVVCGSDAAVRKDIESVIANRFPGYPVVFCEVPVQGPGAVEGIIGGLSVLQAKGADVIVLARGGGDASQLLPFSDEEVCRAICAAAVPVVSAIGHDGDRPLSDDVADARAGTPSIAAALVVPSQLELVARIDGTVSVASVALSTRLDRSRQAVRNVRWTDALHRRVERETHRVARVDLTVVLDRRLQRSKHDLVVVDWQQPMVRRAERARAHLSMQQLRIEALSPARVLERGYAVVRTADGSVIRNVNQVRPGSTLSVSVVNGTFGAVVTAPTSTSTSIATGSSVASSAPDQPIDQENSRG